ncbi:MULTISPECIES: phosphoribosylanthranilate isomerase [unclassified Eikenella]|uniref:phosphoribosylanthranilate isomerase n=1 Tax=unclassified Eikenella TaxID=2639367 RepID=UPI0008A4FBB6|nr:MULTISPECIES: phosphoribosylanthranilate isomerase [unclassified Eikenella]OFK89328.1 N-(5'-phosphoribosyl)anthranilate isomerase [Eikenella sp. HMSC071B05]OFO47054.1 N-(5'-phosphoribosyl)anthranilate isomerase [Eikenella sp. HMSC073A11]
MPKIKICGFTRPQDAQAAAELGADAVGLVFYAKSKRCVDAAQAAEITAALPPQVVKVALFVNESAEQIRRILGTVPIDIVQFHGDEAPEFCRQFGKPYWKAVRVQSAQDIAEAAEHYADAAALLLDAHIEGQYGGTGQVFDWRLLPDTMPLPWILSGGLNPDNVAAALRQTGAAWLDVSSGVEQAPGIKNRDLMADFIRQVRG